MTPPQVTVEKLYQYLGEATAAVRVLSEHAQAMEVELARRPSAPPLTPAPIGGAVSEPQG